MSTRMPPATSMYPSSLHAISIRALIDPGPDPPPYAFVGRMYRRSLRPVILTTSFVAAMWSFIWGGEALFDISGTDNFQYLKTINLVLGILFLSVGFIELYGFLVAWKQSAPMARIYNYLSILAVLIVIAAESIRFSVYFTQKSSLIGTCTSQATGEDVVTYGSFWGSSSDQVLTASDAQQFLSVLFVSLAFAFYHQLLLPEQLPPSQAYNMNNMQREPYNPQSGYQYPAPPGAPPFREDYVPPYDPAKVPDYYEGGVDAPKEKPVDGPLNLGYSGGV
ncbi:hypothetical protein FRB98_009530 [Tulasnella sp. 332]|nr:hypothetical protein FRB98_009530 [Tulasnella sp. 332]